MDTSSEADAPNKLPQVSGIGDAATLRHSPLAGARICPSESRFVILRPHARGGLGQVNVALDQGLSRRVALKEIRPELADEPGNRARFINEATITGQLEHPGIVPVYAAGEDQAGRPYYAMKFVEGRTLDEVIAEYHAHPTAVAFADLLRRFVDVCHAVAYAHSQGVIHRDLKPANIMAGTYGETLILDWGLAKRVNAPSIPAEPAGSADEVGFGRGPVSDAGITVAGHAIGTPGYMPPEQASGRVGQLGPAADIYSLGAVLYQILTNEAPHSDSRKSQLMNRIRTVPPVRPSQIVRSVPRALEAVCLKAMSQRPEDRYASAEDLAGEIDRWLADEPLVSYREPLTVRLVRLARRHRVMVVGLAALLLTAVVALSISTALIAWEKEKTVSALSDSQANKRDAEEQLYLSLIRLGDGLISQGQFLEARPQYLEAWQLARRLGLPELHAAGGLLPTYGGSPPPLMELNGGWASDPHTGPITAVVILPDGRRAVSASQDMTLKVWDLMVGMEIATLSGHRSAILSLAVSPDGMTIISGGAAGDPVLMVWDLTTLQAVRALAGHAPGTTALAFTPDGRAVLCGGADGLLTVLDARTGQPVASLAGHSGAITSIACASDGRIAVTGSEDGMIIRWDLADGGELGRLHAQSDRICSIVLEDEGAAILYGSWDRTVRRWDPATNESGTLTEEVDPVTFVAVAPDGKTALSGGNVGRVRLWGLQDGRELRGYGNHPGRITSIAFSADGTLALSGCSEGVLKLWDVIGDRARQDAEGPLMASIAVSPDSRLALTGTTDGMLILWDIDTGQRIRTIRAHADWVTVVLFSPEGTMALSGSAHHELRLWDIRTGQQVASFGGDGGWAMDAMFLPDGQTLLTAGTDSIRHWEIPTGRLLGTLAADPAGLSGAAFSPNGRRALTAAGGTMRLWDVSSGRELGAFDAGGDVQSVAFSPDGGTVLSGHRDGNMRLWDVAAGTQIRSFPKHRQEVREVRFGPEKGTVMSRTADEIRIWIIDTAKEVRRYSAGVIGDYCPNGTSSISISQQAMLWPWERAVERGHSTSELPRASRFMWAPDGRRNSILQLWDYTRPRQYHDFDYRVPAARRALQRHPDAGAPLVVFGDWYAFRGIDDWAAELFERARAAGGEIPSLALARCYWQLGRFADAEREFRLAIARDEGVRDYLQLCLDAVVLAQLPDEPAAVSAGTGKGD